MRAFKALLRVNLQNILINTLNMGRGKRRSASAAAVLVLWSVLILMISGSMCFPLAMEFAAEGALDLMMISTLLMAVVMVVLFTILTAQSMIFSTKDIDLVLSLPVSSFYVMLSRLLALYLETLLMMELFILPAAVAWLLYGGEGGAAFFVLMLVLGVFLSFIPTLIVMLFGCFISLVVSRMKHKNLFTVVFSLLLIVGVMALSFAGSGGNVQGGSLAEARGVIEGAFPPFAWAVRAAAGPNLPALVGTVLVSVVPFLLAVWVFSRFYKSMLTHLLSRRVKRDYKLVQQRASGSLGALYKKEVKRFFGTPAYLMNSGIMMILMMVGAVALAFNRSNVTNILSTLAEQEMGLPGSGVLSVILLAFIAFMMLTSCPASVSISLEGGYLWILKESPLDTRDIFLAKAGFNFSLNTVACMVTTALCGYGLSLPALNVAVIILFCLPLAAFISMAGLYINLLMPRLDAENDVIVIKQSASVLLSMLAGLGSALVLAGVYLLVYLLGGGFYVFSLAGFLLLAAADLLLARRLDTKGRRLFAAL